MATSDIYQQFLLMEFTLLACAMLGLSGTNIWA